MTRFFYNRTVVYNAMSTYQKIIMILIMSLILASGAMAAADEDHGAGNPNLLISEGKLDEAESILNERLSLNDKDAAALSSMGEVYRKKGDSKKALKYLDRAISIDPKYPMSYMYKGKLYFSMQKFEEVSRRFDLFMVNMRPLAASGPVKQFYVQKLHDICAICFEVKQYEKARAILDEILELSPGDQVAIYNIGIYYYTYERNRSRAYSSFSKAVEIDPATHTAAKARYAIEFIRTNSDPRIDPDFSFIDQEYRN